MPATNLPRVSARLETILASSYSPSATTYTLASGVDINGTALAGYYGLTIDSGTANEQFDVVTIAAGVATVVVRDCDPSNPLASRSRTVPTHGKGASVKITDYPLMGFIRGLLNGDMTFDNILSYTTHPTFTSRTQLADKGYADDIIVGAVPSASTTVAGTVKTTTSTATVVSTDDTRMPTANQTAGLASTTALSSTNKAISQTDSQKGAETYIATTGSANAYVATYSPAIGALAAGTRLTFKANFANTGAVTLNVNGLGATAIKKVDGATALVSGDIANGQIVQIEYDGTNFQMINPTASVYQTVLSAMANATTIVATANTQEQTTSTSYVKLKQFTVNVAGNYNLSFQYFMGGAGASGTFEVFKNGVDTTQGATTGATSPVNGSFTFSSLAVGDTLEIWAKTNNGTGSVVQNATVGAFFGPSVTVNLN